MQGAQAQTSVNFEALLREKDHVYRPMFNSIQDVQRMRQLYISEQNEKKNRRGTDVPDTSYTPTIGPHPWSRLGRSSMPSLTVEDFKTK